QKQEKRAKVYFYVSFSYFWAALSDRTFEEGPAFAGGVLEGTTVSLNAWAQPAWLPANSPYSNNYRHLCALLHKWR
ncbi:MAG: hypothetical protein J6J55_00165, partial [Paludibacteraceae bacterium]|nr:hypothetical protein [Paludibacteraceae bacterium]